jgi:hypothetical protein
VKTSGPVEYRSKESRSKQSICSGGSRLFLKAEMKICRSIYPFIIDLSISLL